MFSAYANRIDIVTKLTDCKTAIGRTFNDKAIAAQALITRGYVGLPAALIYQGTPIDCDDTNVFLAVHGEAVATSNLSLQWLKKGLHTDHWETIPPSVLSDQNLVQVARRCGLEKCLITNPNLKLTGFQLAISVKTILGAVHYDGGEEAVSQVMKTLDLTHDLLDSDNNT
jgi:dsRNA-specific ribonuclease